MKRAFRKPLCDVHRSHKYRLRRRVQEFLHQEGRGGNNGNNNAQFNNEDIGNENERHEQEDVEDEQDHEGEEGEEEDQVGEEQEGEEEEGDQEGEEEEGDQEGEEEEEEEDDDQEDEEEEVEDNFQDAENISDHEDSDNEDGGADEQQHHRPLYTGAPVTVLQSMCLVLTLLLKHNLSQACISDVLEVINLHCPQLALIRHSLFKFKKFYNPTAAPVNKKYYCTGCFSGLESKDANCTTEGCVRRPKAYFVQFSILSQLSKMFKRENFFQLLQSRQNRPRCHDNCFQDIHDGSVYKEHERRGLFRGCFPITFLYNTDGTPVFSSRNYSFWRFFLAINELPFRVRFKRENLVLCGLWFGPLPPRANLFMRSFRQDFQRLLQGVYFTVSGLQERLKVRAFLLAGTCDLPAFYKFLNILQYNGDYGCLCCESKGEQLQLGPQSHTHIYPYGEFQIRNLEETLEYAMLAVQRGEAVMGVKGPSELKNIMLNFIEGTGIDLMHLIINIIKKLLNLHFGESFSKSPFSLRVVMQVVDNRLLTLKPPKFVHRLPRSLADFKHWKASELKMWLFYYSPVVLFGVMRPDYYSHYMKLVVALSYLANSHVTLEAVHKAETLLKEFVREFADHYGERHCLITIHMLLHLPKCVLKLGPLWAYTCFPFENMNGEFLSCVHGTRYVDSQICNMHWQVLSSAKILWSLPEGCVRDFCTHSRKQSRILDQIARGCYTVGLYSEEDKRPDAVLEALTNSRVENNRHLQFFRLLKDNLLYVSEMYGKDLKTRSSFCVYVENDEKLFGNILCFLKVFLDCRCVDYDCCNCQMSYYAIMQEVIEEGSYTVPQVRANLEYMFKCSIGPKLTAVPVICLKSVCFYMHVDDQSYIAEPVNCMEWE